MHRILITGGCGFIGSNLIASLQEEEEINVRVFDNETLGRREHLDGLDVEFMHGDVRDTEALRNALKNIDLVVHLAADTRVVESMKKPYENFTANVLGTFNLLMGMRDAGIEQLINASTGGAIIGEVQPPVREDMVPNPLSPYGASKLAAEGYCSAFSNTYGITATSLRFSNVYGPRSYHKGSVVAHFFRQILSGKEITVFGDGTQTRDFVFVKDLCEGIKLAIFRKRGGVYQLGSGRPTSINELIELMRTLFGGDFPVKIRKTGFRKGEVRHTWCDITKARVELGYEPKTKFGEGLRNTYAWFCKQMIDNSERSSSDLSE